MSTESSPSDQPAWRRTFRAWPWTAVLFAAAILNAVLQTEIGNGAAALAWAVNALSVITIWLTQLQLTYREDLHAIELRLVTMGGRVP